MFGIENLVDRLSNHVGLVYIDLNVDGQASYDCKGSIHTIAAGHMTDRRLRKEVKIAVRSILPDRRRIVTILNRTYYAEFIDRVLPIGLGLVLALFGAAFAYLSLNTPGAEGTEKFLLDVFAATAFVMAGSTAARGFASSKYWNPSNRSVLTQVIPKASFLLVLGYFLGVGGNDATDQLVGHYETATSYGLSLLVPEKWPFISIFLAAGGAIGAFLNHLRVRATKKGLQRGFRSGALNVASW